MTLTTAFFKYFLLIWIWYLYWVVKTKMVFFYRTFKKIEHHGIMHGPLFCAHDEKIIWAECQLNRPLRDHDKGYKFGFHILWVVCCTISALGGVELLTATGASSLLNLTWWSTFIPKMWFWSGCLRPSIIIFQKRNGNVRSVEMLKYKWN